MGSSFNRAIFDVNVQNGLFHWVRVAKHNKDREINGGRGSNMKESTEENNELEDGTQLEKVVVKEDAALEG